MQFRRGINLGGFLSQCKHSEEHYKAFITRQDITDIRQMGFDHVRLPIDAEVFETEDGQPNEMGRGYVTRTVEWCREEGLNIILDLHKAYGYDFNDAGNADKNNLFSDEKLKQRFTDMWARIAEDYGRYDHVAFELLNEVVEENNAEAWNDLIDRAVSRIRQVNSKTMIIYGGIQWNSTSTIKYLRKPVDDNIMFTFHFYEPLKFTHQKAHWVPSLDKNETVYWKTDLEYIESRIRDAVDSAAKVGAPLYCGEFGVIDQAPVEDSYNWFKDVDRIFRKYDIGCAVWSYREMDFGIIGDHYKPVFERLLELWMK